MIFGADMSGTVYMKLSEKEDW